MLLVLSEDSQSASGIEKAVKRLAMQMAWIEQEEPSLGEGRGR